MRKMGILMIINILILADSPTMLKKHMEAVAQELRALRFSINLKKYIWEPNQIIEFLGFSINSVSMTISLPSDKIKKVLKECSHALNAIRVSGRQLAQLIGLLSSTIPAIAPAQLHYRALQRSRHRAVRMGGYDQELELSIAARADLTWWIDNLKLNNGQPTMTPVAQMIVTSDASKTGWGAVCDQQSTGGPWTSRERTGHINILELRAAFLVLKTFAVGKSG